MRHLQPNVTNAQRHRVNLTQVQSYQCSHVQRLSSRPPYQGNNTVRRDRAVANFTQHTTTNLLTTIFNVSVLTNYAPGGTTIKSARSTNSTITRDVGSHGDLSITVVNSRSRRASHLTLSTVRTNKLEPICLPITNAISVRSATQRTIRSVARHVIDVVIVSKVSISNIGRSN